MRNIFVRAYTLDGNEIPDPFVVWSLVGSNNTACPDSETVLPSFQDAPDGPWFNVSMGENAHYKIRAISTDSYAYLGTSIDKDEKAPSYVRWEPITASPKACAGDQGFKLQVIVY